MSRRTPVKELIAEEAGTPYSPIRRSSRIATRRSSAQEDNASQKLKDDDLDRISISSSSSIGSKAEKKTRGASKSPQRLFNDETSKLPARRTRKGSTSSLIEEELTSINRRASPTPGRVTRRSLARSMSESPVSELENKSRHTSTPQKALSESAATKGGGINKRSRRLSTSEGIAALESIKESPQKETLTEDTPVKKKSPLLQTITEKSFTESVETRKAESGITPTVIGDENETDKIHEENKQSKEEGARKRNISSTIEEKELIVVLNNSNIMNTSHENGTKTSPIINLNTKSLEKVKLSLADKRTSNSLCEENEFMDVVENVEIQNTTVQKDLNTSPKQIIKVNSDDEDLNLHISLSSEEQEMQEDNSLLNSSRSKKNYSKSSEEKIDLNNSHESLSEADISVFESNEKEINVSEHTEPSALKKSTEMDNSTKSEKLENSSLHASSELDKTKSLHEKEDDTEDKNVTPKTYSPVKINVAAPQKENVTDLEHKPKSPNATSIEEKVNNKDSPTISPLLNAQATNVMVATNLTPVRRSPRLQHSPSKKSSNEDLSPNALKSNTPPDSIKSKNISGDTDLPVPTPCDKEEVQSEENINVQETSISKEKNDEKIQNDIAEDQSNSKIDELHQLKKDSSDVDGGNRSKNNISFESEPELSASLKKKIEELAEKFDVDSSSDESVSNYIDDMAEEGEEDTPSDGSNDIIDLGESVGSTASEIDSDESYEIDSFIDDNEEIELLSGDEYDLDQQKPKLTRKRRRIIEETNSSDEENKEIELDTKDTSEDQSKIKSKEEEDSDVEKMSTQPYCGLTPPSIVSVRDSPSDEPRIQNNIDDEESITSLLINKEDNLKSLEEIKDVDKDTSTKSLNTSFNLKNKSPKKIIPIKVTSTETPPAKEKSECYTPNNSFLEANVSEADAKSSRKRQSSLSIQETVNVKDISDGSISDRILKVVEVFCSTVTNSAESAAGNISLNVSLDYVGTSPDHPNIHKEHKEIISIVPLHQKMQTSFSNESVNLNTENSQPTEMRKAKKSLEKKETPTKTVFTKSVSNENLLTSEASSMESGKSKKKKRKTKKNDENVTELKVQEESKHLKKLSPKKSKSLEKITNESDSEMSPDLDKELIGKYADEAEDSSDAIEEYKTNLESEIIKSKSSKKQKILSVNKLKEEETSSSLKAVAAKKSLGKRKLVENTSETTSTRLKRTKPQGTVNEGGWEIQYLPQHVKVALSQGKHVDQVKSRSAVRKNDENAVPKKKPKLVPSVSGGVSWNSSKLDSTLKPSTSAEINKNQFHAKDFKNRMIFDSSRVKRMDSTELMKRKKKSNY